MKQRSALGLMGTMLLLAGCSASANKIGATHTTGPRVAIMEHASSASMDHASTSDARPNLTSVASNDEWPQAGFAATHAAPNAALGEAPSVVWRTSIGEGASANYKILARPVVVQGLVITMDAVGDVTAFDVQKGREKWHVATRPAGEDDDAIGGGLGAENGILYVTTGFGEVIALNINDGSVVWRVRVGSPLRAAPTINKGRLYVVNIDNQLQALDTANGAILWHHNGIMENATLMGASNPAVVDQSVIIAYSSGEIYDLRAENGRASWNYTLSTPTQVGALPAIADIRGLPVIDHGQIFAVSHSGRMAAIEERSGDRVWEADIGGITTPVVNGDTVFVVDNDHRLNAVARASGRVMWSRALQRTEDADDKDSDPVFWSGGVLAGDRLWLANSMGQVMAFSAADGAPLAKVDIGRAATLTPVVAGGTLYVVTDDGHLIAMR